MHLSWEEGTIPQDMKGCSAHHPAQNKDSRQDCNNYQGISLLSLVNKPFRRGILSRLQVLADRVYPESQHGFRKKRSTIEIVFTPRLL